MSPARTARPTQNRTPWIRLNSVCYLTETGGKHGPACKIHSFSVRGRVPHSSTSMVFPSVA